MRSKGVVGLGMTTIRFLTAEVPRWDSTETTVPYVVDTGPIRSLAELKAAAEVGPEGVHSAAAVVVAAEAQAVKVAAEPAGKVS